MKRDPSAIFRSEAGSSDLERLSALETLKGLRNRESVTLAALVEFLSARGLWEQFRKITIADLRGAFAEAEPESKKTKAKRKKPRILEDELGDAIDAKKSSAPTAAPTDGGLETEEVARNVLPFIEGNGEVTLDDLEDYTRLDRKVLRHHLGVLVKDGRLERIGTGRNSVYSTL